MAIRAAALLLLLAALAAPAAATRMSILPFSAATAAVHPFAQRHLLATSSVLPPAQCAAPTPAGSSCLFGMFSLDSGAEGIVGTVYWKQIPQSGGGYKLEFTIIPDAGHCINKVVGIVGTTDGSTRLFYRTTETLSTLVSGNVGNCYRYTTDTLTYVGAIQIAVHVDGGDCT